MSSQSVNIVLPATVNIPDPIPGPVGPMGPQGPPGPAGSGGYPPFYQWRCDLGGSYSDQLPLISTWCPGIVYGGKYIHLITPPVSGIGICVVESQMEAVFQNNGTVAARVQFGIGVHNAIPGGKPLYPYLGVDHNRCDSAYAYITVSVGECVPVCVSRWDIVDNALESDQPIPGWPNWTMSLGGDGINYPSLTPAAGVATSGAIMVAKDVRFTAKRIA